MWHSQAQASLMVQRRADSHAGWALYRRRLASRAASRAVKRTYHRTQNPMVDENIACFRGDPKVRQRDANDSPWTSCALVDPLGQADEALENEPGEISSGNAASRKRSRSWPSHLRLILRRNVTTLLPPTVYGSLSRVPWPRTTAKPGLYSSSNRMALALPPAPQPAHRHIPSRQADPIRAAGRASGPQQCRSDGLA